MLIRIRANDYGTNVDARLFSSRVWGMPFHHIFAASHFALDPSIAKNSGRDDKRCDPQVVDVYLCMS